MPSLSLAFVEFASVLLFAAAARRAAAGGRARTLELSLAAAYGLMLEELNIFFFRTYRYSPDFLLTVFKAPVAIALLWSLILISAMAISDRLPLAEWARPFADGLLALLVDIGVDAIAIRLGYWNWNIPLEAGWFGVPAGNLYSWMWVAFAYSLMTRIVRRLAAGDPGRAAYQWLAPVAAYLFLFVAINLVGLASVSLGWLDEAKRLWVFYAHCAFFTLVVLASRAAGGRKRGEPVAGILTASRLAIHLYFLAALALTGMGLRVPALAFVALSAFGLELWIWRRTRSAVPAR